ncbi:MAG TPA: hypothetical protein VG346_03520 [Acidimicrobiales bacterium]|nr:hypothetical protein [Acidimicrobiales bacterium]
MATVDQRDQHMSHAGGYGPAGERRHGRDIQAEVIMIRPERSHRPGLLGSLVTMAARGVASRRVQATSVRSTPRRPSSPAPRPAAPPFPHDAA